MEDVEEQQNFATVFVGKAVFFSFLLFLPLSSSNVSCKSKIFREGETKEGGFFNTS